MEAEKLEGLIIDYIDGKLTQEQRREVEQELERNPAASKLYSQLTEVMSALDHAGDIQPEGSLRKGFEKMLNAEIAASKKEGRQAFFTPAIYRIAAAVALLISGIAIGYWINKNQQREEEMLAIKTEVAETRRLMMAMLDNRESASQRMIGATVAFNMDKTDDEIVKVLTKTMNEDPNTNVRLAALEALGKFSQQAHVRKALIASLSTQKDPIIMIALIRMMVEMKEKEAVKELRRITDDVMVLPAVKDEANYGILKLS